MPRRLETIFQDGRQNCVRFLQTRLFVQRELPITPCVIKQHTFAETHIRKAVTEVSSETEIEKGGWKEKSEGKKEKNRKV